MLSSDHNPDSQRLTHELNNLLDASMRNLGLAIRRLNPEDHAKSTPPAAHADDMLRQLRATDHALRQMAGLLQRWSKQNEGIANLLTQRGTLGEAVDHTLQLLYAAADAKHILLVADVSPQAASLPAGPIYAILVNAVRNSLDAIDEADRQSPPDPNIPHRITLEAHVENQEVRLHIADTGTGITPDLLDEQGTFKFGTTTKVHGHGIGLTLARDITTQLGGQLKLTNTTHAAHKTGATLSIRYPVAAVLHPDPL